MIYLCKKTKTKTAAGGFPRSEFWRYSDQIGALHRASAKSTTGFVMLFTVLLTSIVLAITIGVANISYKSVILSGTARDSEYSFYAADTGIECALFYDYKTQPSVFGSGGGPAYCAGVVPSAVTSGSDVFASYLEFHFDTNNKYCSLVRVYKDYRPDGTISFTKIDSRGYNVPCARAIGTGTLDARRVERLLQVIYPNPEDSGDDGDGAVS